MKIEELKLKKLPELKELAKKEEIKGAYKMNKTALIQAIALKHVPDKLSEMIGLKTICRIKGKPGLWIALRPIKAKGKEVFQFMALLDYTKKTTTFSLADLDTLGYNPEMVAAFDIAYQLGIPAEQALASSKTEDGLPFFTLGQTRQYAKAYEELVLFLNGTDTVEKAEEDGKK